MKPIPNLPNECSREKYTQLANLCNIKVKEECELIMSDIEVIQGVTAGTDQTSGGCSLC